MDLDTKGGIGMYEILIIGGGPIGLFAGFYAGMRKLKGCIIESLPYIGGQLSTLYGEKSIYDIPTQVDIKAKDAAEMIYQQYSRFKDEIPLFLNCELKQITKIDDHYKVVTSTQTFETKSILFCTGNGNFTPRKLEVPGSADPAIIYKIPDFSIFKGKQVLILGGGDSAMDWGVMIGRIAKSITVIHRRNEFRAHEETIKEFKTIIKGTVKTPYDIIEVKPDHHLVIKNKETNALESLPFDYIVVNYGFLPAKNNLESLGVKCEQGSIVVDTDMSCNVAGIFGCGNAVTYKGKLKTLAVGFGEAATAVTAINHYLYPEKNVAFLYSSVSLKA